MILVECHLQVLCCVYETKCGSSFLLQFDKRLAVQLHESTQVFLVLCHGPISKLHYLPASWRFETGLNILTFIYLY